MADCTCPKGTPRMRDKDCPLHGLTSLTLPSGLRKFSYPDGLVVMAETEAAADEMHASMVARRNRS